jgi:serine/threonine protein kinase
MTQPRAILTVEKGNEVGRQYILRPGQKFIIGRSYDLAISLNDQSISRQHASVELSNRGLKVYDLGSRNGTILDGTKLTPNEFQYACISDSLVIGDHTFDVKLAGLGEKAKHAAERTRRIPRNLVPADEFDILGEIGRGATGIVYGAYQKSLKRNVAVKVPRTDVEDQEENRLRFIHEGQLCSQIHSPYVVTIFDMRPVGKRVYIIMELINGGSAKDRLNNSVIPIAEVAKIGEDVALGIHAIHRMNIIHRDLKPSNILLGPEGIAKLADFGIAKKTNDTKGDWANLTPSDEGLGTLGYVSPEGVSCENIGKHSDIYSFGATLYHLVTGQIPFVSESMGMAMTLERILLEDPMPPHLLRPDCPRELSNLIVQMMAKDPEDRPSSAIGIAVKLQKIKENYGSSHTKALQQTDAFSRECMTDTF